MQWLSVYILPSAPRENKNKHKHAVTLAVLYCGFFLIALNTSFRWSICSAYVVGCCQYWQGKPILCHRDELLKNQTFRRCYILILVLTKRKAKSFSTDPHQQTHPYWRRKLVMLSCANDITLTENDMNSLWKKIKTEIFKRFKLEDFIHKWQRHTIY